MMHTIKFIQEKKLRWVLVANSYNPSYTGDRDQEDRTSKSAWANSSQDPI
jgi:hypothetical protein